MIWFLTGGAVPILLLLSGAFFLGYLKLQPFRSPRAIRNSFCGKREQGSISSVRALLLALAGTLGVGNIVGVANAIYLGGAGAVFWMWVSALFATILKYAEVVLALLHRRKNEGGFYGGAAYYIKDYFLSIGRKRLAAVFSAVFALLLILDALSMGCIIQVDAVSASFFEILKIPKLWTGAFLVAITLPMIVKGVQGISALTEVLIPLLSLGYLVLSVAVLVLRWECLPEVFASIFKGAFSAESVGGGVLGFLTSSALRVGTMRGLLSNEAGCGTAPTAHASANAESPFAQGILGIAEVLVDTLLLCTATALVILASPEGISQYGENPVLMAVKAYSDVLGGFAEPFFAIAIFCFGYATLLCWANYGFQSVCFMTEKKGWKIAYFSVFAVCILIGAAVPPAWMWELSDFSIAALTAINLFTVFFMRGEIKKETLRFCSKGSHR